MAMSNFHGNHATDFRSSPGIMLSSQPDCGLDSKKTEKGRDLLEK